MTRTAPDVDDGLGVIRVRAAAVSKPPDEVSLIIGDTLNNLRASLDYAAWELVPDGKKLDSKTAKNVFFPIREQSKGWQGLVGNNLPGVTGPALDIIKRHQPFNRDKDTHQHPLARLANLSNGDKHQRVTVVTAGASWGQYVVVIKSSFKTMFHFRGPSDGTTLVYPGDYVGHFVGAIDGDDWQDVQLRDHTSSGGLAFLSGGFVAFVLDEIVDEVGAILDELDSVL